MDKVKHFLFVRLYWKSFDAIGYQLVSYQRPGKWFNTDKEFYIVLIKYKGTPTMCHIEHKILHGFVSNELLEFFVLIMLDVFPSKLGWWLGIVISMSCID